MHIFHSLAFSPSLCVNHFSLEVHTVRFSSSSSFSLEFQLLDRGDFCNYTQIKYDILFCGVKISGKMIVSNALLTYANFWREIWKQQVLKSAISSAKIFLNFWSYSFQSLWITKNITINLCLDLSFHAFTPIFHL